MNHDHTTKHLCCVNIKSGATGGKSSWLSFCGVFSTAVIIQSLHMIEHIAQVIQKFGLGWEKAHGIIGMLDLEWVHFVFNAALIITLYILIFRCSLLLKAYGTAWFYTFMTATILQSYHMVEHIIKIGQHIQTGVQGTAGFAGHFVNPVWFHFWLNLTVLALIVIPFAGLRVYRQCSLQKSWSC